MIEAAVRKQCDAQRWHYDVWLAWQCAYIRVYFPSRTEAQPDHFMKPKFRPCLSASDPRHDLTPSFGGEDVSHYLRRSSASIARSYTPATGRFVGATNAYATSHIETLNTEALSPYAHQNI
jgi:hypothetical protein